MALYDRQTIFWDLNQGDIVGYSISPFLEEKVNHVFRVKSYDKIEFKVNLELLNPIKMDLDSTVNFLNKKYIVSSTGAKGLIVKIFYNEIFIMNLIPSKFFKNLDSVSSSDNFNSQYDELNSSNVVSDPKMIYNETGFTYENQPTKGLKKIKFNPLDNKFEYYNNFLIK